MRYAIVHQDTLSIVGVYESNGPNLDAMQGAGDVAHMEVHPAIDISRLAARRSSSGVYLAQEPEPPTLEEKKQARVADLDNMNREYILSRYSLERQSTLQLIRGDARADGKTNRFAYVSQVVTWVNTVLTYYYTQAYMISLCPDEQSLDAMAFDFDQFTLTDPGVSIQNALGIND